MRKICYVKSSRSSYRLSTLFIQYFFVYALTYCKGMDEDDTQQIESSHINTRELKFFFNNRKRWFVGRHEKFINWQVNIE